MSDPFDRLRASDAGSAPDVDAIKVRARRIERRRYAGLAGGAAAIALLAVLGILVGTGPNDSARRLAQSALSERSAEPASPAPSGEAEDAAKSQARRESAATAYSAQAGSAPASAESGASEGAAAGAAPDEGSRAAADEPSGFEVTLDVNDESLGPRRGASFTLHACNRSDEAAELTFGSGQRYDFEVSRDGELVWRWSDGMAFTQVIGQERWRPGECKSYSEFWDGTDSDGAPAPPGSYKAVGVLTSSPPMRTSAKSFCLDTCGSMLSLVVRATFRSILNGFLAIV